MIYSLTSSRCRPISLSQCRYLLQGLAENRFPLFLALLPLLLRRDRIGGRAVIHCPLLLCLRQPSRIGLFADHANLDGHESVVLAAQFRTLPVVGALARRLEPGLVEAARDGVDLDPE